MQWASKRQRALSGITPGFTIVELLIVVVVIAILATITIVAYNGITNRAKDSSAQSASSQAAQKIATYAVDNSDLYPQDEPTFFSYANLQDNSPGATSASGYQYTVSSDRKTYCLTTTTNNISYYTTNASQTPTKGACPGHGVNGGTTITNLAMNPSFESDISTVASYYTASSNPGTGGAVGSRFLRATATSTSSTWGPWWNATPVEEGKSYRVSYYIRGNTTAQRNMRVEWINAAGTARVGDYSMAAVTTTSGWQLITGVSNAVPAGAAMMRLTLYSTGYAGSTSDYVDVDGVMVTEGSNQYTYADGASPNWVWNGAQNNSASKGPAL